MREAAPTVCSSPIGQMTIGGLPEYFYPDVFIPKSCRRGVIGLPSPVVLELERRNGALAISRRVKVVVQRDAERSLTP
jgi:hypothetical protein